ncbi:TetR/AcrR family transcriptional regulator [Actinomadura sp. HBU206391]|uniref:TetR/AcrR family transcriptional regulator n=1 Tax=Actinomadura sp. HBU206391 TaxID=2731692 RepID=UPI0016507E08|nr:TetR/AcrR family transcriptional regulator [Actinomadura sp. HBU206391]MBC6463498.1 TetR/AcrR family transcriptional regulator [Actinomadura sp. HBU206391]
MGSAERPEDPAQADLTARARIRDAAMVQFAERGIKGATIRGIAEAAGVSPGLVQHHFGSKEALREACDSHSMEIIRRTSEISPSKMSEPGFLSVAMRTTMPVRRYVARAMVDGSPAAAALFDEMVAYTEEYMRHPAAGFGTPETSDMRAYATTMVTFSLGPLVLHEHLSRALGVDVLTLEGFPRLALAMVEILSGGLVSPEILRDARAAYEKMLDGSPAPPSTGPGEESDG